MLETALMLYACIAGLVLEAQMLLCFRSLLLLIITHLFIYIKFLDGV